MNIKEIKDKDLVQRDFLDELIDTSVRKVTSGETKPEELMKSITDWCGALVPVEPKEEVKS